MPKYCYECKNSKCEVDIFEELLQSKDRNAKHPCPSCGKMAKRTLRGQTFKAKRGKLKTYTTGKVKWEDIDHLPDSANFNTDIAGKVFDEDTIEF